MIHALGLGFWHLMEGYSKTNTANLEVINKTTVNGN